MELRTALLRWFSHWSQSFHPNHEVGPLFYHTSTVVNSVLTQCLIHSLTVKEAKGTEDLISVLCPKLSSMPCILSSAFKPGITSSDQEFTSTLCKPVIILTAARAWMSSSEWILGCLQTEPSKRLWTTWNLWCLLLWHCDRPIWTTCSLMAWWLCRINNTSHGDKKTVPRWMHLPPLFTYRLLFFPLVNHLVTLLRWALPLAGVCARFSLFVAISLLWTIWYYCDIHNTLFIDKQIRRSLGLPLLVLYPSSGIISQVSFPSNRIWSCQQVPLLLPREYNIRKTFTESFSLI